jgi:hypothetical protein
MTEESEAEIVRHLCTQLGKMRHSETIPEIGEG